MIARLTRPRQVAALCAAAAVLAMIASAYRFRSGPLVELGQSSDPSGIHFAAQQPRYAAPDRGFQDAVRWMLLGGVLLGAALWLTRRSSDLPAVSGQALTRARTRWLPAGLGIAALTALAAANGNGARTEWLSRMPASTQFVLLCGGIALLVRGLGGSPARFSPSSLSSHAGKRAMQWLAPLERRLREPCDRRELLLVAGITLLALVLRTWKLGGTVHAFVDELNFATAVREFWLAGDVKLLRPITEVVAFPRLYPYGQSMTVWLLGRNLAGLRLVSAILGTLTVPALYLLTRTLFDRTTAAVAAALLATFPPHLHFSRLALNNVADPFFGTLALACLARGLHSNRHLDYTLAGVMLGLTQYFYEAGRVVFPVLALTWTGIGALIWRPRPPLRGLLITTVAAAIVAAPVYTTLLSLHTPLVARAQAVTFPRTYWRDLLLSSPGSPALQGHLRHIGSTFLIYASQHEASFYYAGQTPFVLVILAPALLLGAFVALWKARQSGPLLPLLWVGTTSLGNSFMVAGQDSPRYVTVFPALALLCAVGLRTTLALLWPDGLRPRARAVLLAALVIAACAGQAWYYFDVHVPLFNVQYREAKRDRDLDDALFRSVGFPPGTQVHVISAVRCDPRYATQALQFLADGLDVDTLTPRDLSLEYLWDLPRTVDHAFFIEPDDETTLKLLRLFFALDLPAYTSYDIPADKQFVLYYAPAPQPGDPVSP
jgi:4-amino-4-deoxy-L-arabinose transferase-like glycosyltransferase